MELVSFEEEDGISREIRVFFLEFLDELGSVIFVKGFVDLENSWR